MKIYKVITNIYHYWKTDSNSGYIKEEHFFLKENNANALMEEIKNNPYWINAENKKESLEKDSFKAPMVSIEIIETED